MNAASQPATQPATIRAIARQYGMVGRFFITGHACDRFRERVIPDWGAQLTDDQVRRLLAEWLDTDGLLVRPGNAPATWLLYVQTPRRFRVVLDARNRTAGQPLPTVVTIRHWKEPPRAELLATPATPATLTTSAQRPTAKARASQWWQPLEPLAALARGESDPTLVEPTTPKARRLFHIRAVVWEYSGVRTLEWMAAEIERRTGRGISITSVCNYCAELAASPTKHQGYLTARQVAALAGVTPQAVARLCRNGRIKARHNPTSLYLANAGRPHSRRAWLINTAEATRYAASRTPAAQRAARHAALQEYLATQQATRAAHLSAREQRMAERLARLEAQERAHVEQHAARVAQQQRVAAAKTAYLTARERERALSCQACSARLTRQQARAAWRKEIDGGTAQTV